MGAGTVWKRLFWKEFREGYTKILMAILAPAILFPAANRCYEHSDSRSVLLLLCAIGVHLTIVIWAANKGDRGRHGSDFAAAHLPIKPVAEWIVSFAVPASAIFAVGAWYGVWAHGVLSGAAPFALAGALDLTISFALCYFVSAALWKWAAIFIGVAHTAGGSLIDVWTQQLVTDADALAMMIRVAIGAAAGSLLFAALPSRKSVAFKQAASLALMFVIVFVPLVKGLDFSWLPRSEDRGRSYSESWHSEDGTIHVEPVRFDKPMGTLTLELDNDRSNRSVERSFKTACWVVKVLDGSQVYIAQQRPGSRRIRILKWDTRADTVDQLAYFRTVEKAFTEGGNYFASVEPKGRYILMSLKSLIGNGSDLWVVNLRNGRNRIVMPCLSTFEPRRVIWPKGRAIAVGDKVISVDLRTMRAGYLRIP